MDSLNFTKYQGAGNDFILIEDFEESFPLDRPDWISSLCDRHRGIGADGVLVLRPSKRFDVKMHIFNSDGKEATMCGNGLRCAAAHMDFTSESSIETLGGISRVCKLGEFFKVSLPKSQILKTFLSYNPDRDLYLVDTGTEHAVFITSSWDNLSFEDVAKSIRLDSRVSPKGVNVNAVCLHSSKVEVRTFEKGVEAETFSCGSGGAAVASVLKEMYNYSEEIIISWKSGDKLTYLFDKEGDIWMIGPARRVFVGSLTISCLQKV